MRLAIFKQLQRDQAGVAAVEYALIASLIAVAVASAISGLGNQVETHYDEVKTAVSDANEDN